MENYKNSKKAYFGQISKVRAGTELARPPTAASRPPSAASKDYDPSSPYAKLATENYMKAKDAYKAQMEKTRKATHKRYTQLSSNPRGSRACLRLGHFGLRRK